MEEEIAKGKSQNFKHSDFNHQNETHCVSGLTLRVKWKQEASSSSAWTNPV